ncbi:MAG: hypothetical protein QM742_16085 [Aquabacterium sp.]
MSDLARRPFLHSALAGMVGSLAPAAWAVRPPPRADSPMVGVDPVLVSSGLTDRWQAAMRRDLGWAARWSPLDSGDILTQLEQGSLPAGVFLTHPRADALAQQGLIHSRHRIAKTDVLLIGPMEDLAGIRGEKDIARALAQVRAAVAAGAAGWQAPLKGSALDALSAPWTQGMPATSASSLSRSGPSPYRLLTRAEWLSRPPRDERLKIWLQDDSRLSLFAEVACSYRMRHEGARLLVNWLQWPLAQGAVQATRPAWQRISPSK